MQLKIRKATASDARRIAIVQVDSWRTTYKNIVPDDYLKNMSVDRREDVWASMIPNHTVYVAETESGEIVGFAGGGKERTGNYPPYKGELYAIYLLESHQRKGLGKQLVAPIARDLVDVGIYSMIVMVLKDNNSKYFYESLGAKLIGEKDIEIGGKQLLELVYGWDDIRDF